VLGGALQAGSINSNMFICARVITGLGMGFVMAIVPPWVSELSQAHDRGSNFSFIFVANFLGITLANWLNFGVRNSAIEFRWRFPLGFMCIPVFIVAVTVPLLPESPRWLMAHDRRDEAVQILCKVRGDIEPTDPSIKEELENLNAIVEASKHPRNSYINLALGGRHSGVLHLGRRAILGFALQQIQQWCGIVAVVTWSSKLFALAGFDEYKSLWMSGLVNTLGMFGTAAAGLVIDRIGRRMSLLVSFIIQGVALFVVAGLIKASESHAEIDPRKSESLGQGAASFVFIYLWFFCMFNIVPSWLYGTEIWPQDVRAKGYSFTILGWAVGCGMTTFLIPIMLSKIGWYTFIFFGIMNALTIPLIYLFYIEPASHSLEEVNLLFISDSPLVKHNNEEYDRRVAAAGGNSVVAARRFMEEVDGLGAPDELKVDESKDMRY
jgi:MFS family permease